MKPGRVSSDDLSPPPMVDCASRSTVLSPALASVMAAARPLGPEPTTMASGVMWSELYLGHGAETRQGELRDVIRQRIDVEGLSSCPGMSRAEIALCR